jgi:predicted transcriptional regulator
MVTTQLTFRCPTRTAEALDEMAEAEHRDRSSMLNYIVAQYISQHHQPTTKPNNNRKKAGVR